MTYTWDENLDLTVKKNVGIGTDTPTEALEVKGKVKLEQGTSINEFSTDSNLTDNSNLAIPTEQAVKTYVDVQVNEANKANSYTLREEIKSVVSYVDVQVRSVVSSFNAQINQANQVIASKANSSDLTAQISQVNQVIQSLQAELHNAKLEIQSLNNKIADLEQKSQSQVTNLQTQINPLVNSPVLTAFISKVKYQVRSADGYEFFHFPNIDVWDIYANGQFYSGHGFIPNTPNRL